MVARPLNPSEKKTVGRALKMARKAPAGDRIRTRATWVKYARNKIETQLTASRIPGLTAMLQKRWIGGVSKIMQAKRSVKSRQKKTAKKAKSAARKKTRSKKSAQRKRTATSKKVTKQKNRASAQRMIERITAKTRIGGKAVTAMTRTAFNKKVRASIKKQFGVKRLTKTAGQQLKSAWLRVSKVREQKRTARGAKRVAKTAKRKSRMVKFKSTKGKSGTRTYRTLKRGKAGKKKITRKLKRGGKSTYVRGPMKAKTIVQKVPASKLKAIVKTSINHDLRPDTKIRRGKKLVKRGEGGRPLKNLSQARVFAYAKKKVRTFLGVKRLTNKTTARLLKAEVKAQVKAMKAKTKAIRKKRKLTGYNLFVRKMVKGKATGRGVAKRKSVNSKIKATGAAWRALSAAEKAKYNRMAKTAAQSAKPVRKSKSKPKRKSRKSKAPLRRSTRTRKSKPKRALWFGAGRKGVSAGVGRKRSMKRALGYALDKL